MNESKSNESKSNERSVSLNDISSYLTIYKKKTDILLIYYLDYIRNYSTLTNDMIQNIELFNDENKMKIINELVIANKSILDYVYEGCDNEKD
jgi:hypothetical protein